MHDVPPVHVLAKYPPTIGHQLSTQFFVSCTSCNLPPSRERVVVTLLLLLLLVTETETKRPPSSTPAP